MVQTMAGTLGWEKGVDYLRMDGSSFSQNFYYYLLALLLLLFNRLLQTMAGTLGWERGVDYLRMDGSSSAQNRKDSAILFNDPTNIRYTP